MLGNLLFSLNSTLPLFFLMLLGYVLHRTGFLSDAFVAGANKFVFYVALPVQLFRDLGKNDVRTTFDGRYVLFCFVVTLVSILVIWALAKVFLKGTGLVGEFVQACYRSSAAILGSAFLQSIYGDASMSSLMILGSVPLYNIMAVVILTLESPAAAQTGSMSAKLKKSTKGVLTNPILLGIAAGFAWSMLHISMPAMLDKTLSNVAGLTSPLALLAIGAGFKGRKALGYLKPTTIATVVKLIILPALFLPLAVHLGFTDEKLVALLVMLGSITTPACYVMAKQMGHEGVLTGSVCVTTTLFSAFSLTFWLFVLRSLGYILEPLLHSKTADSLQAVRCLLFRSYWGSRVHRTDAASAFYSVISSSAIHSRTRLGRLVTMASGCSGQRSFTVFSSSTVQYAVLMPRSCSFCTMLGC